MGIIDEHWCSICKKPQKKGKDDYVEFEFPKWEDTDIYVCPKCGSDRIHYTKRRRPRWRCIACKEKFDKAQEMKHKEIVRKKGLICRACIEKDEKLKEAVGLIAKASNPAFVGVIDCLYWRLCANFKAVKDNPVRCKHIAVIEDRVYCKRGHPGALELTVEKAEKDRYENLVFTEKLNELMKRVDRRYPGALDAFKMASENVPWVSPSVVIEDVGVKSLIGVKPVKPIKEGDNDAPEQDNKNRP